MIKNIYVRTVKLNNRKTCPVCKTKLIENEKIYSSGEYIRAKWNNIHYFCESCFPVLNDKLRSTFKDKDIEWNAYRGIKLPYFIIQTKLNYHPYVTLKSLLDKQNEPRIVFNIINRTKHGTSSIRFFTIEYGYNGKELIVNITNLISKITKDRLSKDKSCIQCPLSYDGYNVIFDVSKILYNNKDKIIGNSI